MRREHVVLVGLVLGAAQAGAQECPPFWSAIGSGANATVYATYPFDDGTGLALYIGGFFSTVNGTAAPSIAKWDGQRWSSLDSGANGPILAIGSHDPDGNGPEPVCLFAGGGFSLIGGVQAACVASWDGSAWSALGTGVDSSVRALVSFDDDGPGPHYPALYVGGSFYFAGGLPGTLGIAKWGSYGWTPVGGGLEGGTIYSLCVLDPDGSGPALPVLIAGGGFARIGGVLGNNIAKWDGVAWAPLGSGVNSVVYCLAALPGEGPPRLYAGGAFNMAGENPASCIACWDGVQWGALGVGLDAAVHALAFYDDGTGPALYAGGEFQHSGSARINRVAKWSGAVWTPLADGVGSDASHDVFALASFDEDGPDPATEALYAGGTFYQAGLKPALNIVLWHTRPCGDMDCSGVLTFDDINPFVMALTDPSAYTVRYPECDVWLADVNYDGRVDFDDINPFVVLLSGG